MHSVNIKERNLSVIADMYQIVDWIQQIPQSYMSDGIFCRKTQKNICHRKHGSSLQKKKVISHSPAEQISL